MNQLTNFISEKSENFYYKKLGRQLLWGSATETPNKVVCW